MATVVCVWGGEVDYHFAIYNAQGPLIDNSCVFIAAEIGYLGTFHLFQKDFELGALPGEILIAGVGVEGHVGDVRVINEVAELFSGNHELGFRVSIYMLAIDRNSAVCGIPVVQGVSRVQTEGYRSSEQTGRIHAHLIEDVIAEPLYLHARIVGKSV